MTAPIFDHRFLMAAYFDLCAGGGYDSDIFGKGVYVVYLSKIEVEYFPNILSIWVEAMSCQRYIAQKKINPRNVSPETSCTLDFRRLERGVLSFIQDCSYEFQKQREEEPIHKRKEEWYPHPMEQ